MYQVLVNVPALSEDLGDSLARSTTISRPKRLINILCTFKQLIAQQIVGLSLSGQSKLLGKISHDGSGLHDLCVAVNEEWDLAKQQARLMRSFVSRLFE